MNKVLFTAEAKRDIEEIKKYISNQLHSPAGAERILILIINKISNLAKFPELGAELSSIIEIDDHEERSLFVEHILLFTEWKTIV